MLPCRDREEHGDGRRLQYVLYCTYIQTTAFGRRVGGRDSQRISMSNVLHPASSTVHQRKAVQTALY